MRKLIVLIALVPIFASATGTNPIFTSKNLYKDGKYSEVISKYEPLLYNLNDKEILILAHSYFMEKEYFKSKILYAQLEERMILTEVHQTAYAKSIQKTK